jgi:hypothetical protein
MPDYCENCLTVTGPPERVAAFFEHAQGADDDGEPLALDFNKFIPQPETITRDMIPWTLPGDDDLEFYWRAENWGAKWQPDMLDDRSGDESGKTLDDNNQWVDYFARFVTFLTAYQPPLPVIRAMSKAFPDLHFTLDCEYEVNGHRESYEFPDDDNDRKE